MNDKQIANQTPLCVDLDGTLVKTDTLHELFFRLLKYSPLSICVFCYYLFLFVLKKKNGEILLKTYLVKNFSKYVNHLPFNNKLIKYLRKQKASGRQIYLVTASLETFARQIVEPLNLFDDVYGSNANLNLRGEKKANFLLEKFGENNFVYIGNDVTDLHIWKYSKALVFVNTKESVKKEAISQNPNKKIQSFDENKNQLKVFFKTTRIHQWAKNILIFIPLLLSHKFLDINIVFACILGFFAFSLLASATYILNDILDIENDRIHKTKRNRPIASGDIGIIYAFFTMAVFFVLSVVIALAISINVLLLLFVYLVLTLSYSFYIKKMIVLDIIMLSFLYLFRLYFGAEIVTTEISFYLFSFSIFIFFSLGAMKRFIELKNKTSGKIVSGRAYNSLDINIIAILGISSGLISVLTYVLYIDQSAYDLYRCPTSLMFGSLLIFYFIVKTWIMANRGNVNEDPIVYAIKTKENYVLLFAFVIIFFFSEPKF